MAPTKETHPHRACEGCGEIELEGPAMEVLLRAELRNVDPDGAVTLAGGGYSIGRWHGLCLRDALKAAHRLHQGVAHLEQQGVNPVLLGHEPIHHRIEMRVPGHVTVGIGRKG